MKCLELARVEELEEYSRIIEDAKKFQREQGFIQWTEAYPNIDTICDDIHNKKGYALKVDGRIAGYVYVDFDGEPIYEEIQGAWRTQGPYAAVHRLALSRDFRGQGLSTAVFGLIEELCKGKPVVSMRMDTDPCNKRMQHVLQKNGFVFCGRIVFQGSDKLAFEKILCPYRDCEGK